MKAAFCLLLPLQFIVSTNCGSFEFKKMPYCWLNSEYIQCLKNNLPCACEKVTGTYYSLVVDTNRNSKNFGIALSKYNLMEPYTFPIKKTGRNEFEIATGKEDLDIWAKLLIQKDSIILTEKNVKSIFYKTRNSDKYNIQHYLLDNVDLLNKSLTKRGNPKLKDILKYDSLTCECNKWKGNADMLSVAGKPHSWVLEIKNDSLFINSIIYLNEDPDPDDTLLEKKFKAYRWEDSELK